MEQQSRKRTDLIGQTGSINKTFKIIDAVEGNFGVDVRVLIKETGEEYWTRLEDIELDR
ncbi:Uncharacterised protein [Niallia circulans]|uniref:hypothetical protein n=1 Tax=Niallia circulans TaxID=1397 RepID=UPI000B197E66|nr:hypothetical protein [Niallia circulans]MED3839252.1 hypothetical protein [Niallia circulans]MED4242403.1 hypothetical protein [Niallia circulans]MED4250505.1 hypothetical protein [Niallia circulans]QKH59807.1 hypothetical protein FOC77_03595 [Niallia circulans]SPT83370.1 Uncharacterised protein [Niallia circulans]